MTTKSKQFATRDSILGFVDFEKRDLVIPEWGGMIVRIRTMTASERDQLEAPLVQDSANGREPTLTNFRARIMALVCINEDGSRMFTLDDVGALGEKHAGAITRIAEAALELSGFSEDDVAELGKGIAATNGSGSDSS